LVDICFDSENLKDDMTKEVFKVNLAKKRKDKAQKVFNQEGRESYVLTESTKQSNRVLTIRTQYQLINTSGVPVQVLICYTEEGKDKTLLS